jgi:putative transposase
VKLLCRVMEVSRSGYYGYFNGLWTLKQDTEEKLLVEVRVLHKQSDKSYGSRRISEGLKAKGYSVGRYQARRLMRKAGVECKQQDVIR